MAQHEMTVKIDDPDHELDFGKMADEDAATILDRATTFAEDHPGAVEVSTETEMDPTEAESRMSEGTDKKIYDPERGAWEGSADDVEA